MTSSHAKSPRPLPFSPADVEPVEPVEAARTIPPYWPRLARALGLIVLAASLHVWVVGSHEQPTASPSAVTPIALQALPGAPGLVSSAAVRSTSAQRVVVQSTLLAVRATPSPFNSRPAPEPVAVGTAGQTVTASATPKPALHVMVLPPARKTPDLKRTNEAPPVPVASAPEAVSAARATPVPDAPPPPDTARRPLPTSAADDVSKQKEIVLAVLREYSRAYDRLDVRATKALYPSVDDRALQRAFRELEGQQVRFASCELSISSSGAGANARCRGDATFRPKVGSKIVRYTDREWTFSLSRDGSNWQILDARMQ